MNKGIVTLGFACALVSVQALAKETGSAPAPADNSSFAATLATPYYLGILGNYVEPDKDRSTLGADIDRGGGFELIFGQMLSRGWGYEVHGWVQTFETGDPLRTDFYHYGLGIDGTYSFGDRTGFTPFVLFGGGVSYNDIFPNTVSKDETDWFANAGVGFVTAPIINVGQLRIRGEARYVYDNYADAYGDVRYSLGIELPLFAGRGVFGLKDSDGDGVIDSRDLCPKTPPKTRVDGDGCTLGKIIDLKGVTFEFNKTRLRPDAKTILDRGTEILKKYPDMNVEVAGHTDNVGGIQFNQSLSEGRAQAVKAYFVEHGVPDSQMTTRGYGESEPVADNSSEEGRERNRRVELRVLN